MKRSLKEHWSALKRSRPGRRFQDRYDRQEKAGRGSAVKRIINLALAVLSFVVGVVLVFIPGPAILCFLLSGALLATESRAIAAVLDRLEVLFRGGWLRMRRFWRRRTKVGKVTLLGIAGVCVAATFHVSYRIIVVR